MEKVHIIINTIHCMIHRSKKKLCWSQKFLFLLLFQHRNEPCRATRCQRVGHERHDLLAIKLMGANRRTALVNECLRALLSCRIRMVDGAGLRPLSLSSRPEYTDSSLPWLCHSQDPEPMNDAAALPRTGAMLLGNIIDDRGNGGTENLQILKPLLHMLELAVFLRPRASKCGQ